MDRIVFVTGATGGIGFAVAKEFGLKGCKVLYNGIDDAQAENAAAEFKKLGIDAEYYHFDVTKENEIVENVAKIASKYDHLDVLINNAGGLGGRSRFEGMSTEFYRFVLALNLDSAFFTTRECIPLLKKGEKPCIINYASNAAWNGGGAGAGIYGTSKAAIVTLTRALAKDLAEYGIRVNAISPGTIDTPFHDATRKNNPALFESFKNNILLKRLGRPEEVASVVDFLCSDAASFITGEVIQINGGQDFL